MTPVNDCQTALPAQSKQEITPITADQGKFNNLSTTVVPGASAAIPQADNSRSGSELLIKYSPSLVDSDTSLAATGSPSLVFRNMEKLEIQNPRTSLDHFGKYFRCADGTLGETDCEACGNTLKEITGVCDLNNFYQGEYHQSSNKGFRHFRYPGSIHAGQLDDGMFFLKMLNPCRCEWQFKLDHHRQSIQYLGNDEFEVFPGIHPYSLYCGKTFEEALATFEQACQGTDIATFIRPLLGFGSDSFGTILDAQKPKVPERPPEDPERIAIAEEDMSLF